ncbi:hypothetical protein RF11_16123 [Thelohanellus kitauei]|uniref:Uncharacterized protein n=1 Tax=Thelohanellus kitauei TaxID=669202 RepID=A0A0C2M601_THEKT|nr:hypothetical protein RF11_16123 [Thelohanellus kitauei]
MTMFYSMKDVRLEFLHWKGTDNVIVIIHPRQSVNVSISNKRIFVSRNEGKTYARKRYMNDGKPIYVERYIPTKDILVGISSTNHTILYLNMKLTLFATRIYDLFTYIYQSTFEASYFCKLEKTTYRVCFIVLSFIINEKKAIVKISYITLQ